MTTTKMTLLGVSLWASVGCSTATMKVPAGVEAGKQLEVKGYSGTTKTFKERDLHIGSYTVTNIDRDWDKKSSISSGAWSQEASKRAYRFDVKAQNRTLHGECSERSVEQTFGGFAAGKVSMACVCTEGEAQRLTLTVVDGEGKAELAGASYEVHAVHQSEQGAQIGQALGYHFRAAAAQGAIDVTGQGRAWVPPSASEDELLGLVCGYAGFFLYRPDSGNF